MTKQTLTTSEMQARDAVFDVYFPILPDADLNLINQTAYLVTDPAIRSSAVNVRHLQTYTQFRGRWVANPTDAVTDDIAYKQYDVVYDESDMELYYLNTTVGTTQPSLDGGTNWIRLASSVVINAYSSTETYEQGNIVVRGGSANSGDLFRYINSTASSGNALPASGTTSNTYWEQIGGSGLQVTDSNSDTHNATSLAGDNDILISVDDNEATFSLADRLSDLPDALPTSPGNLDEYVLQRSGDDWVWTGLTDDNDDTTYSLGAVTNSEGHADVQLTGSDGVTTDVEFRASGDLDLTIDADNNRLTYGYTQVSGKAWSSGTAYDVGDMVSYRTSSTAPRLLYVATQQHAASSIAPSADNSGWQRVDPIELQSAENVVISNLADGDSLVWDADASYTSFGATRTGAWVNQNQDIPENIGDLNDVDTTTRSGDPAIDGDYLGLQTPSGGTQRWTYLRPEIAPYRSNDTYNPGDLCTFGSGIGKSTFIRFTSASTGLAPLNNSGDLNTGWGYYGAFLRNSTTPGQFFFDYNGTTSSITVPSTAAQYNSTSGGAADTTISSITFNTGSNDLVFTDPDGSSRSYSPSITVMDSSLPSGGTQNQILVNDGGTTVSWRFLDDVNFGTNTISADVLADNTLDLTALQYETSTDTEQENEGRIFAVGAGNAWRTVDADSITPLHFETNGVNDEFRDLTQFHDGDELLSVRDTQITSAGLFRVRVASFIVDSGATIDSIPNLDYDQGVSAVDLVLRVDNPADGFPDRYISSLDTSSLTQTGDGFSSGQSITADGAAAPSPAAHVDWVQRFDLSGLYYAQTSGSTNRIWEGSVRVDDNNGNTAHTVPFTIRWNDPNFRAEVDQLANNQSFLHLYTFGTGGNTSDLAFRVAPGSITGISDISANVSYDPVTTDYGTLTNTLDGTDATGNGTLTFSEPIHKDTRNGVGETDIADLQWNVDFNQPAGTASLDGGGISLVRDVSVNKPTYRYPVFSFTSGRTSTGPWTNEQIVFGNRYRVAGDPNPLSDFTEYGFDSLTGRQIQYDLSGQSNGRILWIGYRASEHTATNLTFSGQQGFDYFVSHTYTLNLQPEDLPTLTTYPYTPEAFTILGILINAGVSDTLTITES